MDILLGRVFLLFFFVGICIAVPYVCDRRNVSCGCGHFNVEFAPARNFSGENAIKHSWPMIVYLHFDWGVTDKIPCTGSILNNYFILTAARCVQKVPSFYITIKAGIHSPVDTIATTRIVEQIHLHPNYTGHADGYTNDIALLELSEPLNFVDGLHITPTCIPTINSSVNVSEYPANATGMFAIGWQSLKESKVNIFSILQQGEIFVIDNNDPKCQRSFIDPERQFCGGFLKDGSDPCYGDAGGPIFQWIGDRWEQVGITSVSRCKIPGHPGIFTRLSYYIKWINSVIKIHNESLYTTTTRKPPMDYHCDRTKVSCGCGYRDVRLPTSRIIGGEDAIPNSWSMIVAIRGKLSASDVNDTHICGGTILNEWYILTAAHCIDDDILNLYSNLTITFGMHRQSEQNRTIRKFDRVIVHPLWKQGKEFSNDIALIHLSEPLDFEINPYISRTCRPPSMNSTETIYNYPLNGTALIAVGWGRTQNATSSETLQQVDAYSIHHNDSSCGPFIYDYEVQFCAGVENGRKSVCQGDSGGPILQWLGDRWEQVGITSYALHGCARRGYPPVFTRLAAYYDWIEWNINPNNYTTSTSTLTTETTRSTLPFNTTRSTSERPSIEYICKRNIASCGCGIRDVSFITPSVDDVVNAKFFSWTMIVSIRLNNTNQHSCAGTILSERYILTSAQCVQNQSIWKIKVVSQLQSLSNTNAQTYYIDRIHQHPGFRNRGKHFENDIAILHLTESMDVAKFSLSGLTCVPSRHFPMETSQSSSNKQRLAVIGWTITKQNQSFISDSLQQAQISPIDNKDPICSNLSIDPNKQFCAGFQQIGADACLNEVGGPIFQWMNGYWDQVGIISSGKCGIDGQISIHTQLSYYYNWMMSVLNYDNQTVTAIIQVNTTQAPTVYHCSRKNVTCGCGYANVEMSLSRIMNGQDAVDGSWSMFVSMRISNNSKHICGATLLTDLHVLTAAHCVHSFSSINPLDLTIVAGSSKLSDQNGYIRHIRQIHIHPNFTIHSNRFQHDIAVLELDRRISIDPNPVLSKTCVPQTNASSLNDGTPINGTQLFVIGWGTTKHEQYNESDILQQTEVAVIHYRYPDCSGLLMDPNRQFCAGVYQHRTGPCQGDSGGPIFQWRGHYWEQAGIVSYGNDCSSNVSVQIYTRLAAYADWIVRFTNDSRLTTLSTRLSSTTRSTQRSTTYSTQQSTTRSSQQSTRSSSRSSTTTRRNCALKHQLNTILFETLILTFVVSLLKI